MKNGLIRSGPCSHVIAICSANVIPPPIPVPMRIPVRSASSPVEPAREPGLVERLARRHERELREAVGAALLLAVEDDGRVEVRHLAGDPRGDAGRVERGDRGRSRTARRPARPRCSRRPAPSAVSMPIPVTTTRGAPSGVVRLTGPASRADRGGAVDVAGEAAAATASAAASTSKATRLISAVTSPSTMSIERPGGGRVAVEDVAGAAVVHDHLPAEVADLGDVRVAAADDARVGPAQALREDALVQAAVEARRLGARRRVRDEDQRAVVGAEAALGGQPAQPVHALRADRLVGPRRRRAVRLGDAVAEPREGGAVVEVGHRDVRVAGHDQRAGAPPARGCRRPRPPGPPPLTAKSPATAITSGAAAAMAARTASSACATPWTSEKRASRVISAARTRRG